MPMKKLTPQDLRVLERLENGEWLSTLTIMKELFILRASARVFDLRRAGWEIESRKVQGKPYDEYRLKIKVPVMPPAFKVVEENRHPQLL